MFIFINKDIIIKENNIIGIFNIETKEYFEDILEKLKSENNLINISKDKEKTLILYNEKNNIKGIISNLSSNSIKKRKK